MKNRKTKNLSYHVIVLGDLDGRVPGGHGVLDHRGEGLGGDDGDLGGDGGSSSLRLRLLRRRGLLLRRGLLRRGLLLRGLGGGRRSLELRHHLLDCGLGLGLDLGLLLLDLFIFIVSFREGEKKNG